MRLRAIGIQAGDLVPYQAARLPEGPCEGHLQAERVVLDGLFGRAPPEGRVACLPQLVDLRRTLRVHGDRRRRRGRLEGEQGAVQGVEGLQLGGKGTRGALRGDGFGAGVEVEGEEGEGFGVVHFFGGECMCGV